MTIVVNFDLPVDVNGKADCETYLHRIGRTGRFGKVCSISTLALFSSYPSYFSAWFGDKPGGRAEVDGCAEGD